jgi:hypothetical protein
MLGDAGGLKDYRRGLALALESGDSRTAASIYNNYAINLRSYEGAPAALDVFSSAAGFAEKRGLNEVLLGIRASALPAMVDAGRLDEVVQQTRALRDEAEARHDEFDLMEIIAVRALALAYLGRIEEAEGSDRMLAAARRSARPTLLSMSISSAATVAAAQGATDEVGLLLKEADEIPDLDNIHELAFHIAPAVRAAVSSGYPELGQRLIDHLAPRDPFARCAIRTTGAALAEARNDLEAAIEGYSDAAAGWETLGVVTEQGFALLGWGRCLRGRPPAQREADVLERCRQIFARCAMRPALAEVHGLLGEGTGAGG